ncbi:MAG: ArsR family transcriptional regulator [Dehalococcoidia bacterium]|nr:ArsR family transcriptional regulator [Dehalococcoidia bacterium]
MQGTRERILDLVVEQREVRVEDLATELTITTAAIRRHLDHLRADGLVDVKAVKQATGRPYHVYFATEKATQPVPGVRRLARTDAEEPGRTRRRHLYGDDERGRIAGAEASRRSVGPDGTGACRQGDGESPGRGHPRRLADRSRRDPPRQRQMPLPQGR